MRTHANTKRVPQVQLVNTSPELIDYLNQRYGGAVVKQKTYKEHHKPSWSWRLTHRRALEFLETIRPYMRDPLKRMRADFLLAHYLDVTLRNGKYSSAQLAIKKNFEEMFFALAP